MLQKTLHPRDDTGRLYVSRKEREKDPLVLKIAQMHQNKNLTTILKRAKKD